MYQHTVGLAEESSLLFLMIGTMCRSVVGELLYYSFGEKCTTLSTMPFP